MFNGMYEVLVLQEKSNLSLVFQEKHFGHWRHDSVTILKTTEVDT